MFNCLLYLYCRLEKSPWLFDKQASRNVGASWLRWPLILRGRLCKTRKNWVHAQPANSQACLHVIARIRHIINKNYNEHHLFSKYGLDSASNDAHIPNGTNSFDDRPKPRAILDGRHAAPTNTKPRSNEYAKPDAVSPAE